MRHPLHLLAASLCLTCLPAAFAEDWIIDSEADWLAEGSRGEGLSFKHGVATPEGKQGVYRSPLKTFPGKRRAGSLVLDPSAEWANWEPVPDIGPTNLRDAPVFLALGDNDYWIFGRYGGPGKKGGAKKFKAAPATLEGFEDTPLMTTPFPKQFDAPGGLRPGLGGYHAWQSRDMLHWVHHGPVSEGFSKWVTTAEYADGKLYLYYDYPNDQDPHLYIDDDLTDGKPGRNMGLALADPSHGSDCAVIRDAEGRFHIIFEDWSPINASKRSWDSPLAGHAVSDNGIDGFKFLDPVVDHRTKPTGETATYRHPHWKQHPDWDTNLGEYQVHQPEQPAYGDWAAIAIGGRYYLFADHDPAGGHRMSVGRFTSPTSDGPFEWCGQVGEGHPDPDIGFAEGKFHLITQQSTDWTSPGPWVEKVEVRAGVDEDGDGGIDEWTPWSEVRERYDHTPGFAKQIRRTPAALDLSSLPAGTGFRFECRLTDTTENESRPVIGRVMMSFR